MTGFIVYNYITPNILNTTNQRMLQNYQMDSRSIDWVSTMAEMILQLRIDVRREAYTWFNSLFKDFSESRESKSKIPLSLTDIVKRPLHSLNTKIKQQLRSNSIITLTLNFSLIEKRSSKQLSYEQWILQLESGQSIPSENNLPVSVFEFFAIIHNMLISQPIWTGFLNSDSARSSKKLTHFIDYRVEVDSRPAPFKIQTIRRHQTIINQACIFKTTVRFSGIQQNYFVSESLLGKNDHLTRLLSQSCRKTNHKKQSTEGSIRSKNRTLSYNEAQSPKARTTSETLVRKLSAIHFQDSDNQVTFLSIGEEPQLKTTNSQVKKQTIIVKEKHSSSEFELLKNEREEAFDIYLDQLAIQKQLIPSEQEELRYFYDKS